MELALGQKGPIAPPPVLDQLYQPAVNIISRWRDVITATHWHLFHKGQIDGVDFYVKDRELGYIHLAGEVHLATSQVLRDQLVNKKLAIPFPFPFPCSGYESWVMFKIRTKEDTEHAGWLFKLNYKRLTGSNETVLIEEIKQYSNDNE